MKLYSTVDIARPADEVFAVIEGQPGGFFGLLGSLLQHMAERSVRADDIRLRELLER